MSHNAIFQHLHSIKVYDVLAAKSASSKATSEAKSTADSKQTVVSLSFDQCVEQAVKALSDNHIHSAPVLNDAKECVGFVDHADILKHIVRAAPCQWELKRDELNALKIHGRAIAMVRLDQVVDLSGRDPLVMVYVDSPASQLAEIFAQGVHRVAVFTKSKALAAIVSQSDVVAYLKYYLPRGEMKHVAGRSLQDLGYTASVQVEKVDKSHPVINALKTLTEKKVSAVALVDPGTGHLVGNFSASDLQGLYFNGYSRILDPLQDFLTAHSPGSLNPVVGVPTSSLLDIVNELVTSGLHHLWVVDDCVPVGIITLTDIMRIVVSQ